MNYYNVRDSKGRFLKASAPTAPIYGAPDKTILLEKLRTGVFKIEYDKYGTIITDKFTLLPSFLTGYVGHGTSKKANDDIVFAYDVTDNRFKSIKVSKIIKMEKVD